ncbi:Capsule assembly protein Wzi [Pedobacter hartonius]|uniref:Capsule assembly protein Wzi n=2 Tax=Pedobacter hartonius TaxID=425514 RepID=A0A1H4FRY4_9SPHI|nr:Capsule assembly protein Wzi [Pedobacter hartonius]
MKIIKISLAFILLISFQHKLSAQSLPVGSVSLEDYYRRAQLLGRADSSVSFLIRPLLPKLSFKAKDVFYQDSTEKKYNLINSPSVYSSKNGKLKISLLPLNLQTQFNSHHPYGWNDGAMLPAKGLQTLLSAGAYLEYGMLSIQFRPEIDLAINGKFDTFNPATYPIIVARYYDFYNNIDLPARFGNNEISKAYWGQSSIRLNYKDISFGLSTENLWWGPGIRNSLLMSNTAPGFKHLTLNTRKPVNTAIGSFEGQIIAGRLENSDYGVLEPEWDYFGSTLFIPKPDNWRYLSGLAVTWQPKWVPGLFVGLTRSSQLYHNDLSKFGDYLPFFSSTTKVNADRPVENRDNRSSVFMRWLWPEEHAEIYFEYGKNNSTGDTRNQLLEASRNRAYIFGIRKMLPFNESRDENLLISVEATQLQETSPSDIRSADSWYINKYVRQGYTNRGEVLGAGIGPGANLQSIDVSWVRGLKRLGIQLERYVHNNDFYYYAYEADKDSRRHWTDLSIAFNGEWNYKNFIFNAKLMGVNSLNYQWYLFQGPADDVNISGKDAFNLQMQAGLTYRF